MRYCRAMPIVLMALLLPGLPPCLGQYDFVESISRENGLPVDKVADMATDSKGFLWLGTAQGLYRFDGKVFTRFPLIRGTDNIQIRDILAVAVDSEDKLYLSFLNDGFGVFDARTLAFDHYVAEPGTKDALPSNTIDVVVEVDSFVYLQPESKGFVLFHKTRKVFRHFLPTRFADAGKYPGANELLSCVKDPQHPGRLWITSPEGLLMFEVDSHRHLFFPHDAVPFEFDPARSAFIHPDGRLYMATRGAGILVFNTVQMRWEKRLYTGRDKHFDHSTASAFARGPAGEIWVQARQGLLAYHPGNDSFELRIPLRTGKTPYGSARFWSLGARMQKIIPLRDGSIAMTGRSSDGLYLYHPNQQQLRKVGLDADVRHAAFTRDGMTCLTTDQPFFFIRRKPDSRPVKIPIDLLEGDSGIRDCFADARQSFWLLGEKCLYRYHWGDSRAQPVFFEGIDSLVRQGQGMIAALMDSKQRVWVGTDRELLVLESLDRQDYRVATFSDRFSGSEIGWRQFADFIETDGNRVWFASNRGIGFSDDGGRSFFRYDMDSETDKPFAFADFNAFALDGEGRLWVGCAAGGGLVYLHPDESHPQGLQVLKAAGQENLSTRPAALESDGKGRIWGLSETGVFRIHPSDLTVSHFNRAYGLPQTQAHTLDRLPGLVLMVGAENGYFEFQPDALASDRRFPTPHIHAYRYVTAVDKQVVRHAPQDIQLRYPDNSFEVVYGIPWFWATDQVAFQYRLAGFHNDWVATGDDRRISLAHIPPGSYSLQLRASNAAGEWTADNVVSLPVEIIPAFWQTLWFRLLAVSALLGTGFLLHDDRKRRKGKAQALNAVFEQQLSRLELSALRAQMNPHFIFNAFNSLKWYLIKGDREKADDYLDKFSLLIRKVLESNKLELVPLSEELEIIRLMMDIEQMRFRDKFIYRIVVDDGIDVQFLRVPPLILQPFVENAIWHGLLHKTDAPGKLLISIAAIPDGIRCIIEDNGIGREKARALRSNSFRHTKSLGMQIGQQRIALLSRQYFRSATLVVVDLQDGTGQAAGTRIQLDFCP